MVHGATLVADRFSNANGAYQFDGVDDYISIDPPPRLNDSAMSVSVWVRYVPRQMDEWSNCIIAAG